MKHLDIEIHGKVQGVFFRDSARETALTLGLVGFACNERGGTVYIEIEGEGPPIEKFLEWCREGSESARVSKVEVTEGAVKGFDDFSVY